MQPSTESERIQPLLPLEQGFGVRFTVDAPDLFEALVELFAALRQAKASGNFGDASEWSARMHPAAASRLLALPEEERALRHEARASQVILITSPQDALGSYWDFGDILDCIENGDYDLLEIVRRGDGSAELLIDPHGYPYGGIGCFIGLVEAHGMQVLGYVEYGKYEARSGSPSESDTSSPARKWWKLWK
jgi:hypothetical protein